MRVKFILLSVIVIIFHAVLLWHFHDQFWWVQDEGNYVHVADRMLGGEILHKQVQDFHSAPIHLIHAASLKLFGKDLVSLRYPLVLIGVLQAYLIFALIFPYHFTIIGAYYCHYTSSCSYFLSNSKLPPLCRRWNYLENPQKINSK